MLLNQNFVSICGNPALSGRTLRIYLTDPAENSVWLKVRIQTEDGEIPGESDLIRPGSMWRAWSCP